MTAFLIGAGFVWAFSQIEIARSLGRKETCEVFMRIIEAD